MPTRSWQDSGSRIDLFVQNRSFQYALKKIAIRKEKNAKHNISLNNAVTNMNVNSR